MSKYRFKTEEEFKKEGLWYENYPQGWNIGGNMNKYLGQDVPEEFNKYCDDGKSIKYDGWAFNSQDYVLKESPVVESPKTIDMKHIQEEAKRRFPIGCKFIPLGCTQTYTLIEDSCTYEIRALQIWAHDGHGTLYNNGEWATLVSWETLVSLPETKEKQKFKVGDKVRIIQRKTTNRTGDCPGWDIANGNVGDIGIITYYSEPVRPYFVSRIGSDRYIGSFDEDDLELYQTTEIDFGRLDLEDWLRETKKLNLSLKKLTLHIEYNNTCNYKKVYTKLECEEDSSESRAKCLYQLWNSKLKEKPIVEKEEEYEDPFNFSIIKKEKFIDDVQSVNVTLRTKKKTIKF